MCSGERACAVGVLLHMAYFGAARCSLRSLATYGVLRCCPLRYITVARYGVLRYCPLLYTSLATYGVLRCCPLLYMRVARCIWRSTVLPTAVYECCYIWRTTVLPTTLYEGCYMHMAYYGAAHCSIQVLLHKRSHPPTPTQIRQLIACKYTTETSSAIICFEKSR